MTLQQTIEKVESEFNKLVAVKRGILARHGEVMVPILFEETEVKSILRISLTQAVTEAYKACEVEEYDKELMSENRPITTGQMSMWNQALAEVIRNNHGNTQRTAG